MKKRNTFERHLRKGLTPRGERFPQKRVSQIISMEMIYYSILETGKCTSVNSADGWETMYMVLRTRAKQLQVFVVAADSRNNLRLREYNKAIYQSSKSHISYLGSSLPKSP